MTRLLLILSILPYSLLLVNGIPVNQRKMDDIQSRSQVSSDASTSNIDVATLSNSLGEYYEGIADQVLISFTENILSSAPLGFKLKGEPHYQDVDPKMQKTFLHSLEGHLNFMRGNLIASVQPLVDTNLPWVLSPSEEKKSRKNNKTKNDKKSKAKKDDDDDDDDEEEKDDDENDDDENDDDDDGRLTLKKSGSGRKHNTKRPPTTFPIWSIPLTRDIRLLNQRISTQLGRIVNAHKTAHLMIHQSLARAKKTKLAMTTDDPANTNIASTQKSHSLAPSPYQVTFSYPAVELKQQKFKNKPAKLQWNHNDLETWLQHNLIDIEQILKTEFNKRIQDAVQCIMEDFSV